jgi:N-acetylglutamate synthase-like GNAT family acetyltransferase
MIKRIRVIRRKQLVGAALKITLTMIIRKIEFGSDDFRQACELRNQVLRLPLGLNLFDENLSLERQQLHFCIFDINNQVIACAIGVVCSATDARIRQMAVDLNHQQMGYGRSIIQFIERYLGQQGITRLHLHARLTAAGFYEKLGYVKSGDTFLEINLPHHRMEKTIHYT